MRTQSLSEGVTCRERRAVRRYRPDRRNVRVPETPKPPEGCSGGLGLRVVLPGGDLLSRGLHRTIIGAALFHGPVRDGKAWFRRAMATRQFGGRGRGVRKGAHGSRLRGSSGLKCVRGGLMARGRCTRFIGARMGPCALCCASRKRSWFARRLRL
jgi:hypothetical protein